MRARWMLLVVLASPLLPAGQALTVSVSLPGPVPADGTPFEVHARVQGLEGPAEVKAWLGGEDWQASRTWNGSGFERSDRYVLAIEPREGTWSGWIPLRANPNSRNHDALLAAEEATVGVRVRGEDGRAMATVQAPVVARPEHRLASVPPGEVAQAWAGEEVVARRANRGSGPAVLELAVPRGFEGSICSQPPCQPSRGLVLDRVRAEAARVRNLATDPVDASTGVVVLEDRICPVTGHLAPGSSRWVPPGAGDPATLGASVDPGAGDCRPREPEERYRAGVLWYGGRAVDQAPDPPGWGDAVREAWREHRWAPWRLPAGVEPLPVRTEPVEGAMRAFATREEGLARVLELVHGARERLSVATYLFTNDVVADALAAAARRGVEVTLLVEATPVGGLPESERRILARLSEAGVEVRRFGGPVADHGLQHAKVVVADGSVLLVLTENLTYTGLPPDGDGNLGLGLGVANATLARRVEARLGFAGSSEPWTPDGWREARARVAVVTSPENAWRPNATGWLSSTGRVDGLALQVGPEWGPRRNGWLVDLVEASREHPVRVLASGVPEHAREENRLGLSFLTAHPSAGAIEARLSDPDQGRVHAKALIGSGTVLVGSSNWGLGGVLLNREVNLLVHDGPTAQRFQGIFDAAWNGTGREQGYALPSPGFEVALLGVGIAVLAGRGWGRGRIRRSG